MLGLVTQREQEKNVVLKENMIEYLVELLQDTVDFGWPAAKGAHFVLTSRMKDGFLG